MGFSRTSWQSHLKARSLKDDSKLSRMLCVSTSTCVDYLCTYVFGPTCVSHLHMRIAVISMCNPFPHTNAIWRLCNRQLLKTSLQKENMLIMGNFYFLPNVFNSFLKLNFYAKIFYICLENISRSSSVDLLYVTKGLIYRNRHICALLDPIDLHRRQSGFSDIKTFMYALQIPFHIHITTVN